MRPSSAWRSALNEMQASQAELLLAHQGLLSELLLSRPVGQRILLLRHGESEANASKYDVKDPNLTRLGTMQARSWHNCIADFGADVVLVSPLRRAVQTACHAFRYEQVPLILCRFAREVGWGCGENTISLDTASMEQMLSDLPRGDDVQGIGEALHVAPDDPADERVCLQRLKVVLASRPERTIVVVCHYGVISALSGNRAKNGDIYECEWGPHGDLKMLARHKNPLSQQQCLCG